VKEKEKRRRNRQSGGKQGAWTEDAGGRGTGKANCISGTTRKTLARVTKTSGTTKQNLDSQRQDEVKQERGLPADWIRGETEGI